MRILICNWRDLAHPRAGGAEVYTHEVARRWVRSGHEVTQFCAAVAGSPGTDHRDGVHIVRSGSRAGVFRAARRWYEREGRGRFDLVIDEVNTRPFGCARWVTDAPVVALVHQVCREIWFSELPLPAAALGRFLLEPHWLRGLQAVPVLTVSPSSRDSLLQYGLRDVTVIGAGSDGRLRPARARETRPTVVWLGRLAGNKRPHAALAAVDLLRVTVPDVQMWVIGDGPERRNLERRFGDRATFFGRISAARRDDLLARSHVVVVTSVREGWALVVDEAAAMGTPTVAYDRPGLCDSVPAAGGKLVAPNPAALAEVLARDLPQLVRAPATAGWVGGAQSWDVIAQEFLTQACFRTGLPTSVLDPR